MNFENPNAGYLLLLAIPIILFYFLKPRLRRVPVATTMFWDQVFQQRPSRSPWRQTRWILSLLLNLFFLVLLIGAAFEPKRFVNRAAAMHPINRVPDLFPRDDYAGAVPPPLDTLRIYFFGPKNLFLLSALAAQPNVDVRLMGETIPDQFPNDGLVLLHQIVPKTIPSGKSMIVGPRTDCDLFRLGEALDRPFVSVQKVGSPLLEFVCIENLIVSGTRSLILGASLEVDARTEMRTTILAETPNGTPIYLHRKSLERDVLVLNIDLLQSELPFRVAFPVLISHALNHYRPLGNEWTETRAATDESDFRSAPQWFYKQNSNFRPPRFSDGAMGSYLALSALCLMVLEWILYQRRWID